APSEDSSEAPSSPVALLRSPGGSKDDTPQGNGEAAARGSSDDEEAALRVYLGVP
ncbi:unnamed protein product, partial [Polarella glacialis]